MKESFKSYFTGKKMITIKVDFDVLAVKLSKQMYVNLVFLSLLSTRNNVLVKMLIEKSVWKVLRLMMTPGVTQNQL